MAEISHYCWPCDRNPVHWLMLPDIALHPIARSSSRSQWKCYGNWSLQYLHHVVEGHWTYVWYCCCCSLNCWILVFFFFLGFFSIKGISSLASLSVGCDVLLTFSLSGHFVFFQFYSVIYLGCKYEEILNNYKHIVSAILTILSYPIWDLGGFVVCGSKWTPNLHCFLVLDGRLIAPTSLERFFFPNPIWEAFEDFKFWITMLDHHSLNFHFFHCLHVNKGYYSLWKFWY